MSATNSNAPYIKGSSLLSYLRGIYPGREVISSTEFRAFLNISSATDLRMRAKGVYPRTICLPGVMRDPRIMLIDLAVWLEQGGCHETDGVTYKKRGRGSDVWKKNHPPKAEAAKSDASATSPAPKKAKASKAEAIPDAPQPVVKSAGVQPDSARTVFPQDIPQSDGMPAPSEAAVQPEASSANQ